MLSRECAEMMLCADDEFCDMINRQLCFLDIHIVVPFQMAACESLRSRFPFTYLHELLVNDVGTSGISGKRTY